MAGIRLIAQFRVAQGSADTFVEGWRAHIAEVGAEEGCLQYDMFQSTRDPHQIALLEHWASRDAFDTHWEHEIGRPGGPGVPAVDHLVIESDGIMFHTEIYERRRHEYVDGDWLVAEH